MKRIRTTVVLALLRARVERARRRVAASYARKSKLYFTRTDADDGTAERRHQQVVGAWLETVRALNAVVRYAKGRR